MGAEALRTFLREVVNIKEFINPAPGIISRKILTENKRSVVRFVPSIFYFFLFFLEEVAFLKLIRKIKVL